MIDRHPAETVSDRPDRSDRLDIVALFLSDALPPVSDRSDHKASPRTARALSGPTDLKPCRTEKSKHIQYGPTGPTGPTQIAEGARLLMPSAAILDAFEERAAIMEADGGLARADAERAAAEALGFANPAALYAATLESWRRKLEALARHETSPRGQACIATALAFVHNGWAAKSVASRWTELELFGVEPKAQWERLDRLGAAFVPFGVGAVTSDCMVYSAKDGRSMRRWRANLPDGLVMAWEMACD